MADAERNTILIDLDKPRKVRFNLNELTELADTFHVDIDELGSVLVPPGKKKPDLKALRTFLFIGMRREDPELTEERVGDIVGLSDIGPIGRELATFFNAIAEAETDAQAAPKAANRQARRHPAPSQ